VPSLESLRALRAALLTEQEKRQRQRGLEPGLGAREQLYFKLDKMKANREQLGNPYPEVTAAQKADLESYLIEAAQRHAAAAKS
jgi:hypothetical protein